MNYCFEKAILCKNRAKIMNKIFSIVWRKIMNVSKVSSETNEIIMRTALEFICKKIKFRVT